MSGENKRWFDSISKLLIYLLTENIAFNKPSWRQHHSERPRSGADRDVSELEYSPCSKLYLKRKIANLHIVCRSHACHTDDLLFSVDIKNSFIQLNLKSLMITCVLTRNFILNV